MFHEVGIATTMRRLIYAALAWWGFADDKMRIERYVALQEPSDWGFFLKILWRHLHSAMVVEADVRLLAVVYFCAHDVLNPLFHPSIVRRPGLRARQHDFPPPATKDERNFIPRILTFRPIQIPINMFYISD